MVHRGGPPIQSHLAADLDNVMKPILDAVTGPDGVSIDDNQIQSIRASWMTPGNFGTGFDLTIEALRSDDYIVRNGLRFVEFSPDRCYVLPGLTDAQAAMLVEGYEASLKSYARLLALAMPIADARSVLPIARPFPRSRMSRFSVRHHSQFAVAE